MKRNWNTFVRIKFWSNIHLFQPHDFSLRGLEESFSFFHCCDRFSWLQNDNHLNFTFVMSTVDFRFYKSHNRKRFMVIDVQLYPHNVSISMACEFKCSAWKVSFMDNTKIMKTPTACGVAFEFVQFQNDAIFVAPFCRV